jgi:hypothetical protein
VRDRNHLRGPIESGLEYGVGSGTPRRQFLRRWISTPLLKDTCPKQIVATGRTAVAGDDRRGTDSQLGFEHAEEGLGAHRPVTEPENPALPGFGTVCRVGSLTTWRLHGMEPTACALGVDVSAYGSALPADSRMR